MAAGNDLANLEDVLHILIEENIPFTVHYPTKNSAVITSDSGLNNTQLRVVVEHGGVIGPDGKIQILLTFPKSA
jgi:hypothetical protein